MVNWLLPLAAVLPLAKGAVIFHTVNEVVTAAPHFVTITAGDPAKVTEEMTISDVTTIFVAKTSPVTAIESTIITSISTISVAPVTQQSSYSTTSLSNQINPSTYTAGVTISKPAQPNVVPTASATSAAISSVPTSLVISASSAQSSNGVAPDFLISASAAPSPAAPSPVSPEPSTSPAQPASSNYYSNGDIFTVVDTSAPASVFPQEDLDISLPAGLDNNGKPIHTNKFYANMYLDTQHFPVYAQPYSVWWSNDSNYFGMAISHTDFSQRAFGPDASANPVEYYINPIGLMSVVFSADEFTPENMDLAITDTDTFSVNASLSTSGGSINVPMALGMGFVTAVYDNLQPVLFSQLGFQSVSKAPAPMPNMEKYIIQLFNNVTWNLYATVPAGQTLNLSVENDNKIVSQNPVSGVVIQVGIVPDGADSDFDKAAGMYPVGATVDAVVNNDVGTYTISYDTEGQSTGGTTWIWTLPHQVESFDSSMDSGKTSFNIDSTNKGLMTGYLTNKLVMNEVLHTSMQMLPWSSNSSFSGPTYSAESLQLMATIANAELSQDISGQTNTTSTYTSGKGFDKFAYILLVVKDILKNDDLAKTGLATLQKAFSLFTSNTQLTPLIYDTKLQGVTSSAAQNGGSPLGDFGSPYYNDHHFHYGYMVHAAAIIGYVDASFGGNWIAENKDWVNSLVRDVANPSSDDSFFPVFRMFDWFSGHSWAHGMFSTADGKDEESSSEDVNFAYGMKLWGKVSGDQAMEARGDLMLSVLARSLGDYFYMLDSNTNQPSNFIANKAPGITFENKIDHTTYFGTNLEYIQGIHMIPITPASGLTRSPEFVEQEWSEKLAPIIDSLESGWAGILRSNQALYDPVSAYNYFSQANFQPQWLDGGASQTWYLALAAGLGGSPA